MWLKDCWAVLDQNTKTKFPDSPWGKLLAAYGCHRNAPQEVCPCPAVWRKPPTGAISKGWGTETSWDWRDCKQERSIRLALMCRRQVREPAFG